ncbi:MAG: iron chaperone [Candidatus Acidiferrales bacterium]
MKKFASVDEYIAALHGLTKERLRELRKIIREAAPDAEEVISYSMPALKSNGALLVWYAVFKEHIGFYPKASGIAAFKSELVGYKTSKGAIQFPLEKAIPARLVKKIVRFRVKENEAKS